MVPQGLCKKCKRGYLVEERSSKNDKASRYCNNCFGYAEESTEDLALTGALTKENLGDWSDQEVQEYLDGLFDIYVK